MKKLKGQKIKANTKIIYVIDESYCIKRKYYYNFKVKLGDIFKFKRNSFGKDITECVKVTKILKQSDFITIHLGYPKIKEMLEV